MLRKSLFTIATVLLLALLAVALNLVAQPVAAQDNLLTDPGFEETTMKVVATAEGEGVTFAVNAAWNGWFTELPRNAEWQNRIPNGTGRNNAGFGFVRTGNRSMELSRGFATFTAALYQTVTVPENSNVSGSAYGVVNISGDNSASANSLLRVGIDPTGGNNPNSANVIWSATVSNPLASNGFRQLNVNATAVGTQVTIFLYATQTVPTEGNGVYWDDAVLSVGGPGGTSPDLTPAGPTLTPVPTAPPFVAFVSPQQARDDGSVVHTIVEGDTLAAISVAYNVSMDEIKELNPQIGAGRFLTIGDELLIQRASSAAAGGGSTTAPVDAADDTTGEEAPQQQQQQQQQQQPVQQQEQPIQQQPIQQQAPQLDIRLSKIYYWANDITEMREFYSDIVGLEETFFVDEDSSGLLTYDGGGIEIVFLRASEDLPVLDDWTTQPNYDGGTIEDVSIVVEVTGEEFDAMIARVSGGGVTVFNDAILVPQPGQRAIYLLDPMGNTVQIFTESQ